MRVAVAGWIGSTNLGDELLFAAAKRELEARGATIVALSTRPSATRRDHHCDAASALSPTSIWRALDRVDAVVLVGGTMQDTTSPLNAPLHAMPLQLAKRRGKRVAAVGIGVETIHTALGRRVVRAALDGLYDVTVRDEASADAVASLGLPRPVVSVDLVMTMRTRAVGERQGLAVALRNWSGGGVLPAALRWGRGLHNDWFIASMADALDEIGKPVRFVAFQRDRDAALHQRIAARMSSPATFVAPGVDTALSEIAHAEAVVAMRYHAGVAAVATHTPLVVFDVFEKLRSLRDDVANVRSIGWSAQGVAALPNVVREVAPAAPELSTRAARNTAFDRLFA